MPYLSHEQLKAMGFKALGKNVRVSDRAVIRQADQIELGDHARIDDFCVVSGRVVMGRYTFLGVHCKVAGGTAGVLIEDFCSIAYGAHIHAHGDDDHGWASAGLGIAAPGPMETGRPVRLERYVAVGAGAVVLSGVTLAEGTAVGALALVTQSTEPWSIYWGVPAKRQKERKRDLLEQARRLLAEESAATPAP